MDATAFLRRMAATDTALARLARLPRRSPVVSIVIGLAAAALFLGLRWAASSFYGEVTGFMILLPAVVLAGLAAGRVGGVSAVVGCLLGGLLLVGPDSLATSLGKVATINFILVGLFIAFVAASLRNTVRTLDESLAALRSSDRKFGETELELRAMVDQAAAGIARVDLQGRVVSGNARFAEILGLDPARVPGISTRDVTHPADVDATNSLLGSARRGGGGQVEKRYVRPNGEVVWALTNLQRLLSPEGDPRGFIAVVVDITEAKQVEAALRESEERFRLMADTAPSPVWLTNKEGEVEFVNKALVDFYGQPAEALMGHIWRMTIHPDDVSEVTAVQASARPFHKPYAFQCRFQRTDGAWRWSSVSVNPRFDGHGVFQGYVGMAFDVTDTREALDALAQQEQRQSFLLSLSDRLRNLDDPAAVMAEVNRSIGEIVNADRVGFGELDAAAGVWRLYPDWTRGVASNEGELPVADFGGQIDRELAEGRTVVIADTRLDVRSAGAVSAYDAIEVSAFVAVPLMRMGRLQGFLNVHSTRTRTWTPDEVSLLEDVAERAWSEIERARAEAEVAESEARFRAIADTAPVLIWVTQQDRQRAFVNQAYVEFMGGDYDGALTADWRTYIHPDDQDRLIRESVAGEATGQPFSLEARYKNFEGRYRWLKSFSRPRLGPAGAVVGFVGVAFDVTESRDAQARLAESEARFRTVADSAPALIWMTDARGATTFVNRRFRNFFGVGAEDQGAGGWRDSIHEDDLAGAGRRFIMAQQRKERFEAVVRAHHPVLGLRWLRSEGVPRFDAAGEFQGFVGASLDMTETKQAEDDLKRINELLEERVGEALAEKAKAEADLMHAQRMEAVGRLTGGVAHDFNNLLTVVIGALDLILKSPNDAGRRQKLGEAALAAARRGEGLTQQLLAFSRRQSLRPEVVDINALIKQGDPLLRRAVGEAIDFKLKLRRGGARVNIDPAQFEAALLNLLVNARDAVGDKGRIVVETMTCRVEAGEVTELGAGEYICVIVRDNGSGMDAATLTRVFEPFFTTKSVGKGTGLGLSQVYGFARQSGGGVHIASTLGEGTEIRLYLPPVGDMRPAPARAVAAPDALPSSQRLLLVEDDASVSAVAVEMLSALGVEVHTAETAHEALERLAGERFDVMLSDVVMPGGMTGIELARICAVDHPTMRIILTSGYPGDDVDDALSDAPWPLLRKPYSAEQLRQSLASASLKAEV